MSKAILIVDMPHCMCRQCSLFQSITIFYGVTYWCGGKSLIIDNPNEIQDYCPLKPMPSREDIHEEIYQAYGLGKEEPYIRMRDAVDKVLDEILGGKENV